MARRRDPLPWLVVPNVGIILFWWFSPERFVQPIYPILAVMLVLGLKRILQLVVSHSRSLYRAIAAALVLPLVGGAAVDAWRVRVLYTSSHWDGPAAQAAWLDLSGAGRWVREHTPTNTRVVTTDIHNQTDAVYLLTGRTVVPRTGDVTAQVASLAGGSGVVVLASEAQGFPPFDLSGATGLVPVWRSADGRTAVFAWGGP